MLPNPKRGYFQPMSQHFFYRVRKFVLLYIFTQDNYSVKLDKTFKINQSGDVPYEKVEFRFDIKRIKFLREDDAS
jgi:hypothetical protein